MLPERLTTNLTSLNANVDRLALIVQVDVDESGGLVGSDVYRGMVRNHAKLAYNPVAQWLEERVPPPHEVAAVRGMEEQLVKQDQVAQSLRERRIEHGALEFDSLEARPVLRGGQVVDLRLSQRNRAKELIEDFMIAANGTTARYLRDHGWPSLRRVVRTPKRWDRMVQIAAEHQFQLPATPDSKALSEFLKQEKARDPLRFPDLSLTMIKLMGPGEYAVERPNEASTGHFGLAVKDYSHSTAPNRRYPDLITHRLLKALMAGQTCPYSMEELEALAEHCTTRENDAQKVERRVQKSANALLVSKSIGMRFDALVTGVNPDGVWVRVLHPPVEGKLVGTGEHRRVDVGDRVRVKLVHVSVERGFIDFAVTGSE
jgi:exoribonuclease-2